MSTPHFSVEPNPRLAVKARHADDDVLVVEKPAHMPTQPGLGHERDTLLNALFATHGRLLQNLGADRDYGLLHRLDLETSGLLIVALRPRAYDALRADFAARRVAKFYWAVVAHAPSRPEGVIRKPLLEAPGRGLRKVSKISASGKPAVTAYRVLSRSDLGAVLECRPVTGRLHQVRVHLASVGSAIAGDDIYGDAQDRAVSKRLALHAHRVTFTHPVTGEALDVRSAWPRDLRSVLTRLRLPRPDLTPAEVADAAAQSKQHAKRPKPAAALDDSDDSLDAVDGLEELQRDAISEQEARLRGADPSTDD